MAEKIAQLKQDLIEIKGVVEDLEPYTGYLDSKLEELKDKLSILEDHFKDHLETVENFVCDVK